MDRVAAIVPSAGAGSRMRSKTEKPFIKLCGREIILYPLIALEKSDLISEIIIPASKKSIPKIERLIKREGLKKVREVIRGSSYRAGSVRKGLLSISADIGFVFIHDCARPFLTTAMIRACLNAAQRYGASLSAVRVKPTIKEVDRKKFIKKTLKRHLLWEAQTPQVFKREILVDAYKKSRKSYNHFTDDTALLEAMGRRIKIVEGSYNNIKITTPEDIFIAEAILKGKGRGKGLRIKD
jgi:2-C-methyl-D-erythritol 4-phosphate cytidylyltransferase